MTIKVGDRVALTFPVGDWAQFDAAGVVKEIRKTGNVRVEWDTPWPFQSGLVPLADLTPTNNSPPEPITPNFPDVKTNEIDVDEELLGWPAFRGID